MTRTSLASVKHAHVAVDPADLAGMCEDVVDACMRAGADQAEVHARSGSGLKVEVRMDQVETIARRQDRSLRIVVFHNGCKGVAETGDFAPESIAVGMDKARSIANRVEPDLHAGLADPGLYAREFTDLDVWHPWDVDTEHAIGIARDIEQAGRAVDARIRTSNGAAVDTRRVLSASANSLGFIGTHRATSHEMSASFVVGDSAGMQRDGWHDVACAASDLMEPGALGRMAASRAAARLGARALPTQRCPVMFVPHLAAGLFRDFVSAADGAAIARGASFLGDKLDAQVLPGFVDLVERPKLLRGLGSANYDAEGVALSDSPLVTQGVLRRYVLDSRSARRLHMRTTGNAGGISNLVVSGRNEDVQSMLRTMGNGFLVTELMGHGVSLVTGSYSRGASGFWVENGEVVHPVEGVTVASNLIDMYAGIVAVGNDADRRSRVLTGSVLVGEMTVAGS